MAQLPGLFEIFSARKDFRGRWVGSTGLNRLGLHPARIGLSDACVQLRRRQVDPLRPPPDAEPLRRDGIVVIPGFLPTEMFEAVRREARARVAALNVSHPPPVCTSRGFGPKIPFEGGFDRYDGSTLNRFVDIDDRHTPACAALLRYPRLIALCEYAAGFRYRAEKFSIYQTVYGDEATNPDIQKHTHRDTFHSTVKLWLFLDEVREEDGPFMYVPGSHRMDRKRYRWEYRRARAASSPDSSNRSGSFRISKAELAAIGQREPVAYPVAGNTLVLADVRGFHRRGDAPAGAERLSLHASIRQWPFSPLAY